MLVPQKALILNIFISSPKYTFLGILGAFYYNELLDNILPNTLHKKPGSNYSKDPNDYQLVDLDFNNLSYRYIKGHPKPAISLFANDINKLIPNTPGLYDIQILVNSDYQKLKIKIKKILYLQYIFKYY